MSQEVRCVVCGRKKTLPKEGRFIDGSWAKDELVPEKYRNKWVCSYACYKKLFPIEIEKTFVYNGMKSWYPPELVKVLTRYTDKEVREIADKEGESTISVIVNGEEKAVKVKEFCEMILNKRLTEKDITDTARLHMQDPPKRTTLEHTLRILAAGLDGNLVLITEDSVKGGVNAFIFETNFALDEMYSVKGDRIETHYIFVW